MKNYLNNYGLLAFTYDGKDYIFEKGETLSLPEDAPEVKTWVALKYIAIQETSPARVKGSTNEIKTT